MKTRLKRRSENWRRKLPRPIQIRHGKKLTLLSDCRQYALDLDSGEAGREQWQHAIKLMMAAAEGGDIEAVVRQFRNLLLPQNKLVLEP